jgi:hypothetical protein
VAASKTLPLSLNAGHVVTKWFKTHTMTVGLDGDDRGHRDGIVVVGNGAHRGEAN